MKAQGTVYNELRAIQRGRRKLGSCREDDQAYGAAEALRWVLGEGPRPMYLARPFVLPQQGLFGGWIGVSARERRQARRK
jgi:hypothetical protein